MSKIEWTETTRNPVTGCDRVSPGCDHCYALTMAGRLKAMGQAKYQRDGNPTTSGPGFGVSTHANALMTPLRWRAPRTVFVNSMSDLFHSDVPEEFIARVVATMALTPQHTYQVLTKRHARMRALLSSRRFRDQVIDALISLREHGRMVFSRDQSRFLRWPARNTPWPLPNLWLGVSAEDQQWADVRIPALLDTPAAVRFVSAEPLLGPITTRWNGVDWVIVGGESGRGARSMDPAWVRAIRDHAAESGTAVFVKQLGSAWARENGADGKGGDMTYWPRDLRMREMPTTVGVRA